MNAFIVFQTLKYVHLCCYWMVSADFDIFHLFIGYKNSNNKFNTDIFKIISNLKKNRMLMIQFNSLLNVSLYKK